MSWYKQFIPILLIQAILQFSPINARDDFIISGVLPDNAVVDLNATAPYLTDVVLFSMSPEAIMEDKRDGCCMPHEHFDKVRKARAYKQKKQKTKLRLWLTVGGNGRSDGFKEIIKGDVDKKAEFIDKLVKLW